MCGTTRQDASGTRPLSHNGLAITKFPFVSDWTPRLPISSPGWKPRSVLMSLPVAPLKR
jgi:hypothetical protein